MKLKTIKNACAIFIGLTLLHNLANAQEKPQPDWHTTVVEFAKANFKHPAWGFSHSVRDYHLAKTLAAKDHVQLDDDVLFAVEFKDGGRGVAGGGEQEAPSGADTEEVPF